MKPLKTTERLLDVLCDRCIAGRSTATIEGYRVAYRTYKRIIGDELSTKANFSRFISSGHSPVCLIFCRRRCTSAVALSELLMLPKVNIDFENLLIKILGKDSKARTVPFRFELRKSLHKFVGSHHFKLVQPYSPDTKTRTLCSGWVLR